MEPNALVAELREVARIIQRAAGEGVGFAVFLTTGGETQYASNGRRGDVVRMLQEWLGKTTADVDVAEAAQEENEPEPRRAARLGLEARCAEIGRVIAASAPVTLFLFDFGEGGHLAYFTSMPRAREGVANWCRAERSKS